MESITSMTCPCTTAVVTNLVEVARVVAPLTFGYEGTAVPVAHRDRTAAGTSMATKTAISLLPIDDVVVVFDGLAGIRSWSPPV